MMPSFAGVMPKCASASAIRMSQATASWQPPPTQEPRTAAIVGCGNAASAPSAATLVA